MKRFLVSSLIVCSIIGTLALGPAGVSAGIRHIRISHSPRPPLTTIVIRRGTSSATTPSAACATCPQNGATACAGCAPGPVQINLMQVSL